MSILQWFFSSESLKYLYFKTKIKHLNPKIAIGHDANESIFNFKKIFSDRIVIVYQFGYIFKNAKYYYKEKFLKKKLIIFCAFDDRSRKFMQNYVKAKYVVTGSVKN